ncbi:MAG: hypothetical protein HFI37_06680 [Lachnospiraceae bacterium]|nr:hypothetical protein [Lachnospiraceae bacterium]
MKSKLPRKLLAWFFKLAGIYYALYIGVWTMGIHNAYSTIQELISGDLSIASLQFLRNVVAFLFSLSAAGAIWCVGDILSSKFQDRKEE